MKTMEQIEVYDRIVFAGIDMVNDFTPAGALPVAEGDQVVAPANQVADWVRQTRNGTVLWVREAHPRVTNHFAEYGGPWPEHGVEGTWGAEFIDGLEVLDIDVVLKKGVEMDVDAYSGYMGADDAGRTFETYIEPKPREKVALFIGGLATDYCDKATTLDGCEQAETLSAANDGRKLGIFVVRDAIRAVNINPDDGDAAIAEMEAAGARFVTSQEILAGRVIRARG